MASLVSLIQGLTVLCMLTKHYIESFEINDQVICLAFISGTNDDAELLDTIVESNEQ